MSPIYPLPKSTLALILASAALNRRLSFQKISIYCAHLLNPALKVDGQDNIPSSGGYVLAINHFTRPGFSAWWVALTSSSVIPKEVHWIQSNAWRMTGWQRPFSKLTRWLFPKVAHVLGFSPMPPIPPDPNEVVQRAQAVREVLSYVRTNPQVVIGLAPEGSDEEQGCLKMPPSGSGRFMLLLAGLGLEYLPVGFFEEGETACLRFGQPFTLRVSGGLGTHERDKRAAEIVMTAIAAQLPRELRGEFG